MVTGMLVASSLVLTTSTPASRSVAATAPSCPWTSPSELSTQTPLQLAQQVAAAMTTTQKIDFLALAGASATPSTQTENQTQAMANLCLPSLTLRDGPNGLSAGAQGTTVLPSAISLAATFDTQAANFFGQTLGTEARLQGTMVVQSTELNVSVFDNWGRNFENFGDDPFLTSLIGGAEIQGIESTGTMAEAKHLGPYESEDNRAGENYIVSPQVLHEIYLAPFRAAVAAGVAGVMCAYGSTNEVNTCAASDVLSQLSSLGFSGFLRTDFGAATSDASSLVAGVDLFKPLYVQSMTQALTQGLITVDELTAADVVVLTAMFSYHDVVDAPAIASTLPVDSTAAQAVANSVASEGMVLLRNKGALPLPPATSTLVVGAAAQQNVIDQGLGSAFVSNSTLVTPLAGLTTALGSQQVSYDPAVATPQVLPLSSPSVTGTMSSAVVDTTGLRGLVDFSWTADAMQILVNGTPVITQYPTALSAPGEISGEQAITLPAKATVMVQWTGTATPQISASSPTAMINQAMALARVASNVVVVVSKEDQEGADDSSMDLPGYQSQLITALAAVNSHVVVVLNTGNPVTMPWLHKVNAVIEAWYPGELYGTALANVLTGVVDPSGRLPMAWPRTAANAPLIPTTPWPTLPANIDLYQSGLDIGEHWYSARAMTPLFPFGYGLSYTTFRLSNLKITSATNITLRVTNTGLVPGREVVQAYINFPASANQPTRELAAVASVNVAPGATAPLQLSIPATSLMVYGSGGWTDVPGVYTVDVGDSAAHTRLTGTFTNA